MCFLIGDDFMWRFKFMDWIFNEFQQFLEKIMSGNLAIIISLIVFLIFLGFVAWLKKSLL